MKMKNFLLLGLLIIGLGLVDSAWAKEKKKRKPRKKKATKNKQVNKIKPIPGMFTVTGLVSKTVINDKEVYILTSRSGSIVNLPAPKEPKKEPAEDAPEEINIAEYLEKRVTIFGKGFSRTVKNSPNPVVSIKEIINILEVTAKDEKKEQATPKAEE